jgi:hypothetical protein
LNDVFISYAHEDADWVRTLAERLERSGVRVYFDEWDLRPGAIAVHELDDAIRRSGNAIQVLSPVAVTKPWVREEYAALLHQSVERGLRFIPIVYGEVEIPPFAASRVALDFRKASGRVYDDKVADLVRAIRGEPRPRGATKGPTPSVDTGWAALRATSRPLSEPDQHAFVVCYAPPDAEYGERLVGALCDADLPAWSVGQLMPGDDPMWTIRQQLRYALAVIVVMSPESQASDDITRMILEGQRHSRVFFPILLRGERNYQLANSWYFDARAGNVPGPPELALLRRLHTGRLTGQPVDLARELLTPLAEPAVPAIHIPAAVSLDRLRGMLDEREIEHADLLTTSLLLAAADRLGSGWMRRADAATLTDSLLAGVDALWSHFSGGRYGFGAQRALAPACRGRHADFLMLSVRYGWRTSTEDTVPRYQAFVRRAVGQPGFFPTLRNPQAEEYLDWYDQWTQTTLAVHMRLRRGESAR